MSSTTSSSSSRPSFSRSKTMPAFRRALSMPSVEKSLASLCASSSKGLRRMSSLGKTFKSSPSTSPASAPTESIPVFTMPDYTMPTAAPPLVSVSPLTRPSFRRAMTMPAPVRTLRRIAALPALRGVCQPGPKVSVASSSPTATFESTVSTSTRRRSSVSSVESFSSTEERVTLTLRLRALPSTVTGLITSFISFSRRIAKTYCRTLRRAARARDAGALHEALTTFFAPTPKRVRATAPVPVDPKTLTSDIPLMVYSSPIALPLPKGPAPAVRPARTQRKFTILPTLKEEEGLEDTLCAGW
ncbi:hypothetical protein B0H19DRAFT_1255578 [Mycena capillaripes]|nr:hypothetical protein B0H19DRAFT_1255578 [Mycena capillaripes]